jgi:hypothetical protein
MIESAVPILSDHHHSVIGRELAAQVKMRYTVKEDAEKQHGKNDDTTNPVDHVDTIRFNRRIVADCTIHLIPAMAANRNIKETFENMRCVTIGAIKKRRPGRSFTRQRKSAQRGWRNKSNKKKNVRLCLIALGDSPRSTSEQPSRVNNEPLVPARLGKTPLHNARFSCIPSCVVQ